jgi:phage-related holin
LQGSRKILGTAPGADRKGEHMNELKIRVTTITSIIFNCLGILAIPVLCLLPLNLIDYWTGIRAAPYRDEASERPVKSYKSIQGINKKVSMYLLILVGWIMDKLISSSITYIGIKVSVNLLRQIKKQINEAGEKSGESEGNDEEN